MIDPQKVRKLTAHYAAAFAVYFCSFCMIRSFISVYLLDRGFSYTQVGIISAIHMLFSALIQPNYSLILNRFPRLTLRRFMIIGFLPAVLCSLVTFVLPSKMIFFIPLYILFGLLVIGQQSLMVSLGMEYVNAGVPINPGFGRGIGSVGYAAANLLLGTLIVRYGSSVSHVINIVMLLILVLLLATLPDASSFGETVREDETSHETSDNIGVFLRVNNNFTMFILSVVLIFFGHSIVNTYMPDVVKQFGLGSDFAGAMNGLAAVLELIPMMFYLRISKKISPLNMLKIAAVFFFIKILTAALARNAAGIAFSQSMQLLAYATFAMSSIYFTNQAVKPRNRVMAQGLLVGANETGFTIGSLVSGIVLDHTTIRTLLWIGVAVTAIGSVLMLTAIEKFQDSGK